GRRFRGGHALPGTLRRGTRGGASPAAGSPRGRRPRRSRAPCRRRRRSWEPGRPSPETISIRDLLDDLGGLASEREPERRTDLAHPTSTQLRLTPAQHALSDGYHVVQV